MAFATGGAPNFTNLWIGCQSQCEDDSTPDDEDLVLSAAIRIAIVVERFAPAAGGVENVAWQVATLLDRMDVDVTVLTRATDRRLLQDTCPAMNVRVLRVPTFWQPLRVMAFSRATAHAAGQGAFDVVHGFSRTRHQDLYRAGGGSHRDYMRRSYSSQSLTAQTLRRLSPRHRVLLSIEDAIFEDPTQRIQCASQFVAETLISDHGVSPDRIFLLPNAVDANRFGTTAALRAGQRLRTELDEKAERIWLFPASGWQRKGLRPLLEAFSKIHDPDLRLWIAGRDEPAPWRKLATGLGVADRVRFLGQRDDLEIIYGAVDGMVLPTRYDAFANVTLEAAASGLPIITTNANGAAEWLNDSVVRLDDEGDPESLARALRDLSNPDERRRLGEGARRIARRMDWPGHVSALHDEYQRIVRARAERAKRPGPQHS